MTDLSSEQIRELWASMDPTERESFLGGLSEAEAEALLSDWSIWGRQNQQLPQQDFFAWLILAGRGWGKTRTGAETCAQWIEEAIEDPSLTGGDPLRIALVAETAGDARDVIVEGESGLLTYCPSHLRLDYEPSKRRLTWYNQSNKVVALGTTFSGKEPEQLRGPQFHKAWVDELGKYQYPDETWDNLEFGLRLGRRPQAVVTTTPKPIDLIRRMVKDPMVVVTVGSTYENKANLAKTFISRVLAKYEGTRLGEQELHAKILEDVPNALWTDPSIALNRTKKVPALDDIIIAVDPNVSEEGEGDEIGIMVVGAKVLTDGRLHGYLLEDLSGSYSPEGWGEMVVSAYWRWGCSVVVAEKNQGGVLVKRVITNTAQGESIRVDGKFAKESKARRAIPVAQLYEQGRVHHVGVFGDLESELKLFTQHSWNGKGSPNRADALIWGISHLFNFGAPPKAKHKKGRRFKSMKR